MVRLLILVLAASAPLLAPRPAVAAEDRAGAARPDFPEMPAPGEKVPLPEGRYLIYGFAAKPKLGTAIMKVQVFTGDGQKDTSLELTADAGMPSMRGAHETGDRPFQRSRKGDYLLPIPIVMPGGWEVRFTARRDGRVIFRGRYGFDV
jgi:hypothetical protein